VLARAGFTLALLGTCACGDGAGPPAGERTGNITESQGSASEAEIDRDHGPGPTTIVLNRDGRAALGIEVAPVERRSRSAGFSLPGSVELRPGARRAAAAPLAGRLSLSAGLLDEVATGDVLFSVDAPALRETKASITDLDAELAAQDAWLREAAQLEQAHLEHEAALVALRERWERRLVELRELREAAGGQSEALATAETAMVETRARYAEAREAGADQHAAVAERRALRTGLAARREALLNGLAQVLDLAPESLVELDPAGRLVWQSLSRVDVRATAPGLVDDVEATDGAWVAAGDLVLGLRRSGELWVRAEALQSELPKIGTLAGAIVRPAEAQPSDPREARVELLPGLDADPHRRTAEVLARFTAGVPAWARPGLAVRVHGEVDEADEGFAIPSAAVRRDGLERGVWIEDPSLPARLVFVHVTVLAEQRGWIWIDDEKHHHDEDLAAPNEPAETPHEEPDFITATTRVVVRGAGRLLLATRGAGQAGGHFHADGTFHAEAD